MLPKVEFSRCAACRCSKQFNSPQANDANDALSPPEKLSAPQDSSGTNVLVKLLPIESAIWPCTVAIVEGHPNSEVHLDVNQGLGCFHVHLQGDAGENGKKTKNQPRFNQLLFQPFFHFRRKVMKQKNFH